MRSVSSAYFVMGLALVLVSCDSGSTGLDPWEDGESPSGWVPIRTLRNGGFEDGLALPNYWWRGGAGFDHFSFGWQGVESWEGARAVSISRFDASDSEFAYWAQTIFADDFRGGPATLRVRINTDLVGQGVVLVIRGDDTLEASGSPEASATTQGRMSITGTRDWAERTLTLDPVPYNIKTITVYLVFAGATTGTVLFDAVSLAR